MYSKGGETHGVPEQCSLIGSELFFPQSTLGRKVQSKQRTCTRPLEATIPSTPQETLKPEHFHVHMEGSRSVMQVRLFGHEYVMIWSGESFEKEGERVLRAESVLLGGEGIEAWG